MGTSRRPVRHVLLLANAEKARAPELLRELERWLAQRDCEVRVEADVRAFAESRAGASSPADARSPAEVLPDLLVVLGGDGAILAAVRAFAQTPVPTLGINLGKVGFLAATPAEAWPEALEACLAGRVLEEPRMRLLVEWRAEGRERQASALNEMVLQRSSHHGMIRAALWAGARWVTGYRADGLIVATPSGSTAYSLSAGGPILETSLEAVVVTPISPQSLSNRPLVLPSHPPLRLRVQAADGRATLAVDGHTFESLAEGDEVTVRRHPVPYPLLWLPGMDPYRRLRERLGWRGSLEPDESDAGS